MLFFLFQHSSCANRILIISDGTAVLVYIAQQPPKLYERITLKISVRLLKK